jgi:hypothetical protein
LVLAAVVFDGADFAAIGHFFVGVGFVGLVAGRYANMYLLLKALD